MEKTTVGILYICTGRYSKFWNGFYNSANQKLFFDCDVRYFVFTDDNKILNSECDDIVPIFCEHKEWPFPTLERFDTFLRFSEAFSSVEYLVFCNANLLILGEISFFEVFGNCKLFGTIHPGYFEEPPSSFPVEKNENSLAFTNCSGDFYICGGFNGGRKSEFLDLCEVLNERIVTDLSNGIIARWHDESHLNRFYSENVDLFNILPPIYCAPIDNSYFPVVKIGILDKSRIIGVSNKGIIYAFRFYLSKVVSKIRIILRGSR